MNIWRPGVDALSLLSTLESEYDAVLAFAARDNTLFAGHQGGVIKVSLARAESERDAFGADMRFARCGISTA